MDGSSTSRPEPAHLPSQTLHGASPAQQERGTILVVCTGNVCRSPYIERLLTSELLARGLSGLVIASVGTAALVGEPIAQPMADIMRAERLDPAGHHARRLTATDVRAADLIITAERAHRRAVAKISPASLSHTFTLAQAARLSLGLEMTSFPEAVGDRLRGLAEALGKRRGVAAPSQGARDDVADPWLQPVEAYRSSAALMRKATLQLVRSLG